MHMLRSLPQMWREATADMSEESWTKTILGGKIFVAAFIAAMIFM